MVTILAVLGVLGVLLAAAFLSTREEPLLAEAPRDAADVPLPDGPLSAEDVSRLRFSLAPRGYRMSEVDLALERLAAELADRDRRLGLLEAAASGAQPPAADVREAGEADLPVAPSPVAEAAPSVAAPVSPLLAAPPVTAPPVTAPVAAAPVSPPEAQPPVVQVTPSPAEAVPPLPPVTVADGGPAAAAPAQVPPVAEPLPAADLGGALLAEQSADDAQPQRDEPAPADPGLQSPRPEAQQPAGWPGAAPAAQSPAEPAAALGQHPGHDAGAAAATADVAPETLLAALEETGEQVDAAPAVQPQHAAGAGAPAAPERPAGLGPDPGDRVPGDGTPAAASSADAPGAAAATTDVAGSDLLGALDEAGGRADGPPQEPRTGRHDS